MPVTIYKFLSYSVVVIILATLSPYSSPSMFNTQPRFILKTEKNKEFNKSCLIDTFDVASGNIAECLEHCLENCQCQSFQICDKTVCQLCSSHKEENSLLLHDNDTCIYAMYEMRDLTEIFQNLEGQSSCVSCPMKYNCCQQSGICPENKVCKSVYSREQPWKRFTCECRDGYHGDNCDQPITSCQGYAKGSPKSGMYKVVNSIGGPLYEVYCHFDSDGSWTLVQSYSFANRSLDQFTKSLSNNLSISENALTWSGYRLSKARMESIKNNSSFLHFTCDYEKHTDLNQSDFVQLELQNLITVGGNNVDILELSGSTHFVVVLEGRGKIGEYDLNYCNVQLYQTSSWPLHMLLNDSNPTSCMFNAASCSGFYYEYFGGFHQSSDSCVKTVHRCVQNENSTTQIWFSTLKMT